MKIYSQVLALAILTSGCVSNIGNIGLISPGSQLNAVKYKKLGECKAVDKVFVFFVPWGESRIESALKQCMASYPGASYVSNASIGVYQNYWVFFAWTGFEVKGTVFGPASAADVERGVETFHASQSDKRL